MVHFRKKRKTSPWYLKKKKNFYVKSVQIRSFFWSEYGKIRTRKKSIFGHFSHCEFLKISTNFDTETLLTFLVFLTYSQVFKNGICFFTVSNLSIVQYLFHYSGSYLLLHQQSPMQHYTEWKVSSYFWSVFSCIQSE